MSDFDFEKLDVYNRAVDFADKIFDISDKFPRQVQYSLGTQLQRASLSIPNNIAEGSNKVSKKEKKVFYGHSLNSARECIPMLTISKKRKYIDITTYNQLREECLIICRMLRKLINSVSKEKSP